MSELNLYVDTQYASPYAMSVFVALTEKRLPFNMTAVDLERGENHAEAYAGTSITGRVPTLVDGDFSLSESSAITEYLEEKYPEIAIYPKQLQKRARVRQIQAWLRSDLLPIRQERSTEVIFYQAQTQPLSEQAHLTAQKLFRATNQLITTQSQYLFEDWCIADIDLALMLNRLILAGDDVPEHLVAYAKYQWQRPSVQLWVNQKRPLL
ncbi:glutathione transferase [Aquirhabdus sp.]|uniref:glutathione transferase n=1 Tax=Aquirhabdus sp. TaxID=2824160 RepID=UPI00396CA9F4